MAPGRGPQWAGAPLSAVAGLHAFWGRGFAPEVHLTLGLPPARMAFAGRSFALEVHPFERQHGPFHLDAATKSPEGAIASDDAMARDNDAHGV